MSDIRAAIADDIKEYEALCQKYGEKPVRDGWDANPYCEHAARLKERASEEAS